MKAREPIDPETHYDLYLIYKGKHFFCKRYQREGDALQQADEFERHYGKWGYTTKIIPIDLATPRLRTENGRHTVGPSPQEPGDHPTE
ncbi:hypothetical protein ES703_14528 [subsurface metagenome]